MPRPRTPQEALAAFEALGPSSIRLGLDRIEAALEKLGRPDRSYPVLQVAGTNGKGSTCAFLTSVLRAHGKRVGLYTSPHLERVNERFQVDGGDITDDGLGTRLLELFDRLPDLLETPSPLSYFEVGTLAALWHFARERVDVVVLEVGLGGRLDATTAVTPVVTGIAPVSFDHQAFLGDTLAQIAGEKAGIAKPGVPLVVAKQADEAMARIVAVAERVDAPLVREGIDYRIVAGTFDGRAHRFESLVPGLLGAHQHQNAALALAMLECAEDTGFVTLDAQAVREGVANTRWPGRLEWFAGAPPTLLDGAHNEAGAQVLAAALPALAAGRDVHWVFGVLADKDVDAVLRAVAPLCRSIHLTPLPSDRSLAPALYAERVRHHAPNGELGVYGSIPDAWKAARAAAGEKGLVLGAGSLVLVGALRSLCSGGSEASVTPT